MPMYENALLRKTALKLEIHIFQLEKSYPSIKRLQFYLKVARKALEHMKLKFQVFFLFEDIYTREMYGSAKADDTEPKVYLCAHCILPNNLLAEQS